MSLRFADGPSQGQNGGPFSGVAVQIEQDTVPGPEAKGKHLSPAPRQQVGVGNGNLKTGWCQKVRAGQESTGGLGDLGRRAREFRPKSELLACRKQLQHLCACVHRVQG